MNRLALLAGAALALALPASSRADCGVPRVDVADWPLVRSASVPGFTLRLPRAFVRDTAGARWTGASRAHFALSRGAGASASPLPAADGRAAYARCEERLGSATAVIVSYGDATPSRYVVLARIRWPDGEELDVRAAAGDREQLQQVLAAVRTIRRAGA